MSDFYGAEALTWHWWRYTPPAPPPDGVDAWSFVLGRAVLLFQVPRCERGFFTLTINGKEIVAVVANGTVTVLGPANGTASADEERAAGEAGAALVDYINAAPESEVDLYRQAWLDEQLPNFIADFKTLEARLAAGGPNPVREAMLMGLAQDIALADKLEAALKFPAHSLGRTSAVQHVRGGTLSGEQILNTVRATLA